MFRFLTPKAIKPPFARYSHGVEVPAGKRLVLCSGQVGIAADDGIPEDAGAQAELCFANIAAILGEAGLGLKDIVRINAYVTDRAHLRAYMDVRDRLFCRSGTGLDADDRLRLRAAGIQGRDRGDRGGVTSGTVYFFPPARNLNGTAFPRKDSKLSPASRRRRQTQTRPVHCPSITDAPGGATTGPPNTPRSTPRSPSP